MRRRKADMKQKVAIDLQSYEDVIRKNIFYVDKTAFIKEWWESEDSVTLITRPRRFGKTLNIDMLNCFFSNTYENRGDLFEGLSIWEDEKYRQLQGTYPVINLSFAGIKETNYETAKKKMCEIMTGLYSRNSFLRDSEVLTDKDKAYFDRISKDMDDVDATLALHRLSEFLYRYYGKKVIILLDEYDTPMLEAYVNGFWDELVSFTRSLFNAAFKTNPYVERAVITGITRISKESIFSDLNNLEVVTTTSDRYATAFGFTEKEVFAALDQYGLGEEKEGIKYWYDGFTFGTQTDIYNPWSVLNFLAKKKYDAYWANTSGNSLVSNIIKSADSKIKKEFEDLLKGGTIYSAIDEQLVYNQLDDNETAIWSLLVASGYLKIMGYERLTAFGFGQKVKYELKLTNGEVNYMFYNMIRGWFEKASTPYNEFIKAMLCNNLKEMNIYMNRVARDTFSYFDTGKRPSEAEPERFYHGFVLGLIADLSDEYVITSNRESGYGRYDVMIEPKDKKKKAVILEFKVHEPDEETDLEETIQSALAQIEDRQYEAVLLDKGFQKEQIYKYGFAVEGKKVLIG